ncbi:DUF4961 domain-containing protein [Mesonia sp.]|uniref:DUF4961 domain-containing protein n=1 Tax=Mesonia sp. TaxID=1960830 RepID=UPI00176612D6|nr:DUF4961 domain-containing protein [Mesonia sp.]HIB38534.1 DUF4961 domain-containing protein [Mesonia sp.]
MKKNLQVFQKKGFFAAVILMIVASSCIVLNSIEYPDELVAGEVATFTMNTTINVSDQTDVENDSLVIAMLMPTSWNARENSTLTYTSDLEGDEGVQTMSPLPLDEFPREGDTMTWSEKLYDYFGMGPNVDGDMEWVVFATDNAYTMPGGETINAQITIETLIGDENLSAQLGFFVNFVSDGFYYETQNEGGETEGSNDSWKVEYTDCIPVTGNTTGAQTIYCENLAVGSNVKTIASSPYPNPFTSEISIKLGVDVGSDFEVVVYDIMGKKVSAHQGVAVSQNQEFSLSQNLDLSKLNSGMYLVSVSSGSQNSNFRIIKK